MAKGSDAALLKSVPLFEGFSPRELKLIASQLREEWFNEGEEIVRVDDPGGRFYVIAEGRAKILIGNRTVRTVEPGDYFGEMSLIDDSPRAATVRADTQVKTVWLGRTAFLSCLRENWPMTKKVLADLCARVRAADTSTH
jgi:CRP-like cAMP-binding protein